jgi:hypothetical protein
LRDKKILCPGHNFLCTGINGSRFHFCSADSFRQARDYAGALGNLNFGQWQSRNYNSRNQERSGGGIVGNSSQSYRRKKTRLQRNFQVVH